MGNLGAASTAQPVQLADLVTAVQQSLIPTGTILPFSGASGSIPTGFLICAGQAVVRATYSALNSLYSTASYPYGSGDGSTTFNVPDLRGRMILGLDNMNGSDAGRLSMANTLGLGGGAETHAHTNSHSLTAASHQHTYSGTTSFQANYSNTYAGGGATGATNNHSHTFSGTVDASGSLTVSGTVTVNAADGLNPYMLMNWIVKT